MTDGLKGLELYFSTEKAEKGAERFRAATDSAADAVLRAGATVDSLDRALDRLGGGAGKAAVPITRVGASGRQAGEGMRSGAAAATQFENRLSVLGRTSGNVGRQLRLFLGIAGAVTGISAGINSLAKYEDALRILGSIAGATGDDLRKLEQAAVDTSRGTRFTPTESIRYPVPALYWMFG